MENETITILIPETDTNTVVGCSGGVGSFGGTATF